MRRDIHRQRGVIGADMVVGQVKKIAGEVITGFAALAHPLETTYNYLIIFIFL
jgi:hypothetical protein